MYCQGSICLRRIQFGGLISTHAKYWSIIALWSFGSEFHHGNNVRIFSSRCWDILLSCRILGIGALLKGPFKILLGSRWACSIIGSWEEFCWVLIHCLRTGSRSILRALFKNFLFKIWDRPNRDPTSYKKRIESIASYSIIIQNH